MNRKYLIICLILLIDSITFASFVIPNGSVTTVKILDHAVTQVKRGPMAVASPAPSATPAVAGGLAMSDSSGTFSTTSLSTVDVTNLIVTITTTGRPIFVGLIPDGVFTSIATIGTGVTSNVSSTALFLIEDELNNIYSEVAVQGTMPSSSGEVSSVPVGALYTVIPKAAGTYTFKVRAAAVSGGTTPSASVLNARLIAYEL